MIHCSLHEQYDISEVLNDEHNTFVYRAVSVAANELLQGVLIVATLHFSSSVCAACHCSSLVCALSVFITRLEWTTVDCWCAHELRLRCNMDIDFDPVLLLGTAILVSFLNPSAAPDQLCLITKQEG